MQKFHMVPDGKRFLNLIVNKINKEPFRPAPAPPAGERQGAPAEFENFEVVIWLD